MAVAGKVISWLKDNVGIVHDVSEVAALAASVPDTGGVLFVPAFSGLFAPRWRSDARGVIVGVTAHTRSAHIVRAALESVAFQCKEVLDAMANDAARVLHAGDAYKSAALRVDGAWVYALLVVLLLLSV